MKESSYNMNEEKSILKWAGLAGIVGVFTSILSLTIDLTIVPIFVATESGSSCGPPCVVDASLLGFPSVKASVAAANVFYFLSIIFFAILFLGLYRALRVGGSLGPALFGTGVCLMGLVLLGAGALPSVAFAHLSEVYHAAGTTSQDQTTLVLVSHGVQAIFNETDTVGGYLLAAGLAMFGLAMFQNSSFGKRLGGATIVLSAVALVGISLVSVALDNPNDPFFVILVLVLPLVLGLKLYRLSKILGRAT
ncbi:hypothetical protein E6H23_09130 [Candidatus Bathyarchaeota archaeon]|nr:MAG: hypothetical protein E6H23_09130 [Candidatus Bathyarchaeota archaeon]